MLKAGKVKKRQKKHDLITYNPVMMNKNIITGAIVALAAGIAVYIYNKKKSRLSTIASDTYDKMNDTLHSVQDKTVNIFS